MTAISQPLTGSRRGEASFSVTHFSLDRLGVDGLPVLLLDDFRVSGRPFGPHPHAGFSAITYVFEDSDGALRSRDSLGNDLVIGAGGIVWLQAGRGALHEETPQDFGRELHGAQIYVNLRAANRPTVPRTFWLNGTDVPVWSDSSGNRVRVVVGRYGDVVSPLTPTEPFDLLDVQVAEEIAFDLAATHITLVYARDAVTLRAGGNVVALQPGQLVAVSGGGSLAAFSSAPARLLVLSGAANNEPTHAEGPFVLNHRGEVDAVVARFRRGEMGTLEPRR